MDTSTTTAQQVTDPTPKPTPPANGEQGQPRNADGVRLPDDHPLVKAYNAEKAANQALKEKARRYDELEESQKSEAEKAAERLAKAEREVEQIPAKVAHELRAHLVELHKISDEDAELFLTANDPTTLRKQVARLVAQAPAKPVGYVPTMGTADPSKVQVSAYELGREAAEARYSKK